MTVFYQQYHVPLTSGLKRFISAMWYTFLGLVQAEFSRQSYSCAAGLGSEKMVTQLLPELLPNIQVRAG